MSPFKKVSAAILIALVSILPGCFMYHEQGRAIVGGLDMDQTLEVARLELEQNRWSSVLTVWAIRDQSFTGDQAATVANLYFEFIGRVDSSEQKARKFSVWHLTWAISNIYRLGDEAVRAELGAAYEDAATRVETLDRRVAKTHFGGEKLYMGDVHAGGRAYARSHLVVPGNDKYLQSKSEYRSKEAEK